MNPYVSMVMAEINRLKGEESLAYRRYKASPSRETKERLDTLRAQIAGAEYIYKKTCLLADKLR